MGAYLDQGNLLAHKSNLLLRLNFITENTNSLYDSSAYSAIFRLYEDIPIIKSKAFPFVVLDRICFSSLDKFLFC